MPWISINPASEPPESVAIVAAILYIDPEEVTPNEMAEFYNDYFDPTVCQLTNATSLLTDYLVQEPSITML